MPDQFEHSCLIGLNGMKRSAAFKVEPARNAVKLTIKAGPFPFTVYMALDDAAAVGSGLSIIADQVEIAQKSARSASPPIV